MKNIDHIAIAVSNLEEAEKLYREVLGLEWKGREEVMGQKVMTSIFQTGSSRVELITPLGDDSPIAGFLEKKGSGLHHICLQVDDIEAEMKRLKEKGVRLLNETPTAGVGGSRVVFLHPRDFAGVLIELMEK